MDASSSETSAPSSDPYETIALLNAILESSQHIVIFALDRNYQYLAFNSAHKQTINTIWGVDIAVGMNMLSIIKNAGDQIKAKDNFDRALRGEQFVIIEEYGQEPNRFFYENTYSPIWGRDNTVIGLTLFLSDVTARLSLEQVLREQQQQLEAQITQRTTELQLTNVRLQEEIAERQRTEEERMHLQQQVIQAQQAALYELSTPLIPIAEDIVVMPLIGSIDSQRANQVMETLLMGVATNHAATAILDITGVQIVDTHVANALVRAAQAVQLLGTQVVLTGIRPDVAETMVSLGIDLGHIVTRSTLQSGIAYALGETGSLQRSAR